MKWTSPSDFEWESAPLSSFSSVFYTSVGYVLLTISSTWLSSVFLPAAAKNNDSPGGAAKNNGDAKTNNTSSSSSTRMTDLKWRPWFNSDLKAFQFVHNINLVAGSAVLLIGSVYATVQRYNGQTESDDTSIISFGASNIGGTGVPTFLFCEDATISSPSLYYWSYLYYLSKYYELLDTFLQLARGKPPPNFALHVYHHALVLFMAWSWVDSKQSLQLIGLWFNTAVHVVMYTYFLQRTITGKVPRWKSFVTLFQIFQFATSMVCTAITLYQAFGPQTSYPCAGMKALFANVLFNITLLHSFVDVYKAGKKKKTTHAIKAKSQ